MPARHAHPLELDSSPRLDLRLCAPSLSLTLRGLLRPSCPVQTSTCDRRILKALKIWKVSLLGTNRRLHAATVLLERARCRALRAWATITHGQRVVSVALAHWGMVGTRGALHTWVAWRQVEDMRTLARLHDMHASVTRAMRALLYKLEAHQMRALAHAAFGHLSARRAYRRWAVLTERAGVAREAMRRAALAFVRRAQRKALKSWRGAATAGRPVHRALRRWRGSDPVARAFGRVLAMAAEGARRRRLRACMRWLRLRQAWFKWGVASVRTSRTRRLQVLFRIGERRALRSWVAMAQRQRRLCALVRSFKGMQRAAFGRWCARTQRPLSQMLGAPTQLRTIRPMTWRECCSWLNAAGIRVSHSPPALLRALRTAAPYSELVRRLSAPFWVRHKMAHAHTPPVIFGLVQQLLDTDVILFEIGCQRLDVGALESGKALEHLELLAALREVYEIRREAEAWAGKQWRMG